ncbi:MAG TPA: FTR1 family protein [Candidatus Acidoferrum sp.]|jgi:high-affinity iron transporter|nr:FTR1 family protein [Candidatus Acidoferrum sp.]
MKAGIKSRKWFLSGLLSACCFAAAAFFAWPSVFAASSIDPLAPGKSASAAVLDIGVLVFREGLECVLVLAAVTSGIESRHASSRKPVAFGALAGISAALLTWTVAVRFLDDLSQSVSALALQAATGLVAVVVLLVVMNWFFHKLYWTGWISLHTKRKRALMSDADGKSVSRLNFLRGMALLGFTSVYREGFEVVLFLQSYRLRLGGATVLEGVCVGLFLTAFVAIFTFVAHQRMPYRRMLVFTGVLLGIVLIVMVGEQAQEMQLAHWIPVTNLPELARFIPSWMGLWFSVFPTVETLLAQAGAAFLVLGSYFAVNRRSAAADTSQQVAQFGFGRSRTI